MDERTRYICGFNIQLFLLIIYSVLNWSATAVRSPAVDERTRYIHGFYKHLLCKLWRLWHCGSSKWKHILNGRVFWSLAKYFPIFKTACIAKNIWRIVHKKASIWNKNMHGLLSLDIISSLKLTLFLELPARKTVHFLQWIMSVNKSVNIFVQNGGY